MLGGRGSGEVVESGRSVLGPGESCGWDGGGGLCATGHPQATALWFAWLTIRGSPTVRVTTRLSNGPVALGPRQVCLLSENVGRPSKWANVGQKAGRLFVAAKLPPHWRSLASKPPPLRFTLASSPLWTLSSRPGGIQEQQWGIPDLRVSGNSIFEAEATTEAGIGILTSGPVEVPKHWLVWSPLWRCTSLESQLSSQAGTWTISPRAKHRRKQDGYQINSLAQS